MGKRGRAREPTAVLEMKGSWRGVKRAKTEPEPPSGLPDRPEWLADSEVAVWDQVVDNLDKIGTLATTDGVAIARYCALMVQWVLAKQYVDEHGMTFSVVDKLGNELHRTHPLGTKYLQLLPHILRLEQEFGLTPSARAGLSVRPQTTEQDKEKRYFG